MSTFSNRNAAQQESVCAQGHLTVHAEARMRQRGFREEDMGILLACGSRSHDGALTLTQRDAALAKDLLRRRMLAIDRLTGMTAILDGTHVVTVYRLAKSARLRRARREERD